MFARSYEGTASMTRRDQKLLNKQFRWLNRRPRADADGLLVLSIASAILICLLLGSAGIA
jgi:hypothetical protein